MHDRRDCTFFFFNDTATTEIYTLSLHDALPISDREDGSPGHGRHRRKAGGVAPGGPIGDRKSTRLNSSHSQISYAVFCLKKKTATKLAVRVAWYDLHTSPGHTGCTVARRGHRTG